MNPGNAAPAGIALIGLMLGMRHATDPDHVVAVTAILSRERRWGAATLIGIVWGLGHTATVLAVGAAIIMLKIAIPPRIGLAMEFAVGLVLMLLGIGAVASLWRRFTARANETDATDDEYATKEQPGAIASALTVFAANRPLARSFAVGLVHGLAGSAAIALLVLSAIPQPLWATLYLAVFCLGTIIGMGMITTAVAAPFMIARQRMSRLHQGLVTGSGLLSFGFGLVLTYQIGIVDRLFGAMPLWTPR